MFRSTLITLLLVAAQRRISGSPVHSPSTAGNLTSFEQPSLSEGQYKLQNTDRTNMRGLQWELMHPGRDLPETALEGGYWTSNGNYQTHYVGRVFLNNQIIPGHVAYYSPNWLISWILDGAISNSPNFEVAVGDSSKVRWVPGGFGSVPANAVVTGIASGGELLYSCRVYEEILDPSEAGRMFMSVGTLRPSSKVCAIEFYGQHLYPIYEVLSIEP